jgi:hypothetical protein
LLSEVNLPLAQSLDALRRYPVCLSALTRALKISPLRKGYNFKILGFFIECRMTHVCEI